MQLAFTDLEDLPPAIGKHLSSRPLPGSPAYISEQELLEWQRWQTYVPKILAEDGWLVEKAWDEGRWKWIVWHLHTYLKTIPFSSRYEAIEQARRLATFYELLPAEELRRAEVDHPTWFTKLPTLLHWYQYDSATAQEWYDAYQRRHPQP